jgi:septum formation protein
MIYLASQSPRRRELLNQIAVTHEVLKVQADETPLGGEPAQDYVYRVTLAKAQAGADLKPDQPILAADTCVIIDEKILGKPEDMTHALHMLGLLSGRTHQVLTGVALIHAGKQHYRLSTSQVRFRTIAADEARRYWESGEPCGKAGGYAIQGLGALFIEQISGSYSGIMGLPLFETGQLLGKIQGKTRQYS